MFWERRNGPLLGWKLPRPVPRQILWQLLPSFVAKALGHIDKNAVVTKPHATSWLNGLRGIAALIVANMHVTESSFLFIHEAYGLGEDGTRHFIQLPIVRLVCAGHFMVTVFFVISGYALSYGPLETIHDGRVAEAVSRLGSATFRRIPRLFLPVLPVLLATAVPQSLGMYYDGMAARRPSGGEGSYWRQLGASEADLVRIMHRNGAELQVSVPQAWTLDLECRGSLLVFAACLAFRRVGYRARLVSVLLMAAWLFHALEWSHCMFLSGMALADMNIARRRRGEQAASVAGAAGDGGAGGSSSAAAPLLPLHDREEKALSPSASLDDDDDGDDGQQHGQDDDVSASMARAKTIYNRLAAAAASASIPVRVKTAGLWTMLILSLLLGGWPVAGDVRDIWPYSWATWLLGGARPMTGRLALSVASVMLVASLDRLPPARRLLDSLLVRYLGEISYGLYLCHILAARTTLSQGLRIELEERWGEKFAPWAIVLFGIVLPGAVWLGDLHWRLVDKKVVRFTRWLSEWIGV